MGREGDTRDRVVESRKLRPVSIGCAKELLELPAVAVLYARNNPSLRIGLQFDFADLREIFADLVTIAGRGCAQPVEIHLRVEIQVRSRALARVRITRVIEAALVRAPGEISACGGEADTRYDIGDRPAGGHVEHVHRAAFVMVFGQRDGNTSSVGRRLVESDRRATGRVHRIGIHHHVFGGKIGRISDRNQHRLFLRRLVLEGEDPSPCMTQVEVGCRFSRLQRIHPLAQRIQRRQRIQHRARVLVLSRLPRCDAGIVAVFEPAVVVDNGGTEVTVDDRLHGRWRRSAGSSARRIDSEQQQNGNQHSHCALRQMDIRA